MTRLTVLVTLLVLTACSGGGNFNPVPQTGSQNAAVVFNVKIPSAGIAPQSASIKVNSGTPTVISCTSSCTATVTAPVDSDTFAVAIYDGQNGTGNVLLQGSATQTINAGLANIVSVTFNGIASSAVISTPSSVTYRPITIGTPAKIVLNITAKDAENYVILGTYRSPISLVNLDTTGSTSMDVNSISSSGGAVTLTYTGSSAFTGTRIRALIAGNAVGSFLLLGPCNLAAGVGRAGYYPCDLRDAYNLTSSSNSGGSGQTVAIVNAFDDPSAESDLAVYRAAFRLPPCTTANGCFMKVAQDGSTTYPAPDSGWAGETSLDIDMVSAICPNCHILLVEATNNNRDNLYTAVDEAALLHATEISNSWGSGEYPTEIKDEAHFNHPGVAITVSSGDSGFLGGTAYPASSQYVTAVGGTSLVSTANTRGWSESVWFSDTNFAAGSGCSAFITQPLWQTPALPVSTSGCAFRMVSDVSAVADPSTGVWVYDTYQSGAWGRTGGTSVSAPIIAAVYALSGNAAGIAYGSYPYLHASGLYDVTVGFNGTCAANAPYYCNAEIGYDGPTGLGTPNGATTALIQSESVRSAPEFVVRTPLNYHPGPYKRACSADPRTDEVTCFALIRTD